jgi:methylated-DNA-[protein]-cysteine S-methyltransferase
MSVESATVASPVGLLRLLAVDGFLTRLGFDDGAAQQPPTGPTVMAACDQLASYFARTLRDFTVPLAPHGSEFQTAVWAALRTIPYGDTASYGAIAARLGLPPGASRAVGLANGANPIAIVIPCHRVIGSDGSLVGYGGGLWRKQILLDLEAASSQPGLFDV